ncbi:hypothetical protein BKA63DRAFT_587340 [Paraphoma chrysanthemicola]|nr:hypothetical protein BKA63DRAFT_587340 [Paraphoma chrysanthemicola]
MPSSQIKSIFISRKCLFQTRTLKVIICFEKDDMREATREVDGDATLKRKRYRKSDTWPVIRTTLRVKQIAYAKVGQSGRRGPSCLGLARIIGQSQEYSQKSGTSSRPMASRPARMACGVFESNAACAAASASVDGRPALYPCRGTDRVDCSVSIARRISAAPCDQSRSEAAVGGVMVVVVSVGSSASSEVEGVAGPVSYECHESLLPTGDHSELAMGKVAREVQSHGYHPRSPRSMATMTTNLLGGGQRLIRLQRWGDTHDNITDRPLQTSSVLLAGPKYTLEPCKISRILLDEGSETRAYMRYGEGSRQPLRRKRYQPRSYGNTQREHCRGCGSPRVSQDHGLSTVDLNSPAECIWLAG